MKKFGMRALIIWMVIVVVGLGMTFGFKWKPLLGLDLQGGLSATLTPKPGVKAPTTDAVEEAKNIIRQRVDALGIAEPDVVRSGKTVVVQLPGLKTKADQDRAKKIIGSTAKLTFRPVMESGVPKPTTTIKPGATTVPGATTAPGATTTPSATAPPSTAAKKGPQGLPPIGTHPRTAPVAYQLPTATSTPLLTTPATPPATTPTVPVAPTPNSPTPSTPAAAAPSVSGSCTDATKDKSYVVCPESGTTTVYVLGPVGAEGTAVGSAQAALDANGNWVVNITIKGKYQSQVNKLYNACHNGVSTCPAAQGAGAGSFGRIAIVLDGKVVSAATVNALDLASNPQGFQISGSFTHAQASTLALQLRYGALPVEFQPATLETVSATLGSSSLHAGLVSGLVGLILVALYMVIFYRMLGVVAILSLLTSTAVLWTTISYLGTHNGLALTLAGITGIIVSVGVAVDSNVVFYEHLREDMTKGRTLRSTVNHSFSVAWRTIVSADFVSLIGAVILYLLTIGSVRGFAFFLGLSTVIDLLASWFFMRPVVFWMAHLDVFNRRPGLLGVRPHRGSTPDVAAPMQEVSA